MKRSSRAGFSLLELVLAVGLSVALVALLGFAIDLHLTKLDASRSTIERAQIARAILDRIAADLRATTSAPTQDVSEAMAAAEASAQFNVDEVDNAANAEASDSAEPEPELYPAGLSGSAAELVIDCRRTLQSLTTLEAGATPTASLEATWSRVRYAMSADTASPGLARTEVGRDASVWSAEQGSPRPRRFRSRRKCCRSGCGTSTAASSSRRGTWPSVKPCRSRSR